MDPSEELLASIEAKPVQNPLSTKTPRRQRWCEYILFGCGIIIALLICVYSIVQAAKQLADFGVTNNSSLASLILVPVITPTPTSSKIPSTIKSNVIISPTPVASIVPII